MKRRDFVRDASAGLAGMLLPGIGLAQNKPCPPPSVSVTGGTVATTSCSTEALSDWNARSTGAGVVWAHNFNGDAEVQAFRDELAGKNTIHLGAGLGPNSASPNCLEITIPRGLYPGDVLEYAGASGSYFTPSGGTRDFYNASQFGQADRVSYGHWVRPMSAVSSNGRAVPDPADGGRLPRRTFNKSNYKTYRTGYYGNAAHQAEFGTWQGDPNAWDGNEFWLQYWVKFSRNRWNPGLPDGKLVMMLAYPADSYPQELVMSSTGNLNGYQYNWLSMYTDTAVAGRQG